MCPRTDSGRMRGRPREESEATNQTRRIPAGPPRISRSAGRDANNPTVTTPVIYALGTLTTAVSMAVILLSLGAIALLQYRQARRSSG